MYKNPPRPYVVPGICEEGRKRYSSDKQKIVPLQNKQ